MNTYFLLHWLKSWILPPGVNILLALVGLFFYFSNRSFSICLIITSIFSLWLFSAPFFAYGLVEKLQDQHLVLAADSIFHPAPHSAIVVLGGGDTIYVEQDNQHAVSESTLNRLRYGAYLHKKMHLPIIVSGGKVNGSINSGAALMANSLRDDFNISTAIKEDKSINTDQESKELVPILKSQHIDSIYLVTDAWHMPRSVYLFKKQGINVIPAPMGFKTYDHHYSLLSFSPNIHALEVTSTVCNELIGLAAYH